MTEIVSTEAIEQIVAALAADEVVALPTETVYGLAARAASAAAVARIFAVKGRPADNPLIVHCADVATALGLGRDPPPYARRLAEALWPGPVSLVLQSAVDWPWVQAGHATLAVRVPGPQYLRRVIAEVGPLAAPSANLSGRPSPTTAAHCLADLEGRVPLIVDGGPCEQGLESTVVDCTGAAPAILRPGPVSAEQIQALAQGLNAQSTAASPGTRHPHYRPRARVLLVDDLRKLTDTASTDGASAARGAAGTGGSMAIGPAGRGRAADFDVLREWRSLNELGHKLYAWLREADDLGLESVIVERVPEAGLGLTVMNRLRHAAGA